MGFRTVVIKSRVKLELRLNMMVIRGDVENKIFIAVCGWVKRKE